MVTLPTVGMPNSSMEGKGAGIPVEAEEGTNSMVIQLRGQMVGM